MAGFKVETVTVANGATDSSAFQLGDRAMLAVRTPGALTSVAISFKVADTESGTYTVLKRADGTTVAITVAASQTVAVTGEAADALAPCVWVKLVCGSAEGGDRVLTLLCK